MVCARVSFGSISIFSLIINEVYSAPSLSGRLATSVTIYPISVILYLLVVVLVKVLFVVIKIKNLVVVQC